MCFQPMVPLQLLHTADWQYLAVSWVRQPKQYVQGSTRDSNGPSSNIGAAVAGVVAIGIVVAGLVALSNNKAPAKLPGAQH